MLQKTNRLTLVEQVVLQMEALIESGTWPVGMRIPPEPALMADLNVSRNTLREAIRALTHAGLLQTRQGDGTYVCSSSALGVMLHRRILRTNRLHTLEVRHALEREGAYLAAQRRTDDEAHRMLVLLDNCESALARGETDRYIAEDILLHQCIISASHNEILIELYEHIAETLESLITSLIRQEAGASVHSQMHRQLVEAIVRRDVDEAVEVVHRYIAESKAAILAEGSEIAALSGNLSDIESR
ncbi:FadR family transcriptional regulator [Alicyclobacillus cycloheptanicus]|uniref:DNA-binding FadR family transcriptional regulator n=1 Tax=Alicyclobacillus cycloheptanicus TaxID=1457 RepID=A0ABT9XML8_9BACL|nr:FadR/GntR family transcriptional regulator [Alicyclobacillus cycloheptanicus]MDQ0191375.1 DNA-binding FadR family transcriptional regulator [Alicyclobacillus cycloheptanicus]WDM02360.1 FadR family transcriptional regulator [Alicyclobacillus cycloheptanicus]